MADEPAGRDLIRNAMGPGRDCMPVEMLEQCVDPASIPPDLAGHLDSCAYCRAELELLRSFLRAPNSDEAKAVRMITKRMQLPGSAAKPAPFSWWKGLFHIRWLSPAAVAMAGVLFAVAVGLEWRHGTEPRINVPNQPETEVLRSGSISVIAPLGDLTEVPNRIAWQPVSGAAQYQVRLLEVDRTQLWNTSTSATEAEIPAAIRSKVVPAKTLLIQVSAMDHSNRKLAESDFVRFRLLQNVYPH